MRDEIDDLLGIDTEDPMQRLAIELVESDDQLMRKLVECRHRQGLTQGEVGRRMGVTQPAVAAFERPDADPKLSTIRRYALAIGVLVKHSVTEMDQGASMISTESASTGAAGDARIAVRPGSTYLAVVQ